MEATMAKKREVKTTKEYGLPIFGKPGNGNKTTNGEITGRGSSPKQSHDAFVKESAKAKKRK